MELGLERALEDRLARERWSESKAWIEARVKEAQQQTLEERRAHAERMEAAATVLEKVARGGLMRIEYQQLQRAQRAALMVQRKMRGIWGRRLFVLKVMEKHAVVKSATALKALRKRSKITARFGPYLELVDSETNALWYLEPKSNASSWLRPRDMEWTLAKRQKTFEDRAAFEKDLRLVVDARETDWHRAFSMADVPHEFDDLLADRDGSTCTTCTTNGGRRFSGSTLSRAEVARVAASRKKKNKTHHRVMITKGDPEYQSVPDMSVSRLASTPGSSFKRSTAGFPVAEPQEEDSDGFSSVAPKPVGKERLAEVLEAAYPKRSGDCSKRYRSGVVLRGLFEDGTVVDGTVGQLYHPETRELYVGQFGKNNRRHGKGVFRNLKTGRVYVGEFKDGLRDGWGYAAHPNGEIYEGEFKRGLVDGVGRLESANGDVLEGCWERGRPHGLIRYWKANGDSFIGTVDKGVARGPGVLACHTGETYRGEFDKNERHGRGVLTLKNGGRLAGIWVYGEMTGFGVFIGPNGEKYVGQFKSGLRSGQGRYTFENGDFYDGDFSDDKASGKGLYWHSNGNVFLGEWRQDRRHGRGLYVFASGSKIDGYFSDNRVHGKAVMMFANGNKYKGHFKHNKKHGLGEFTWAATGTVYTGQFIDDKISGTGTMTYAEGHAYRGEFKNDKKNGRGRFEYANGDIYEGDFLDDVIHGLGKFTYNAGTVLEETYDGEWRRGKKNGRGRYAYKTLDPILEYDGMWLDNLRHGKGTLRYKDGGSYVGDFLKERMTGRGLFVYPNGAQYEGQWLDNKRHGEGTELTPSGTIFRGRFWRGIRHGPGVLTYLNGDSFSGLWDSGTVRGKGDYVLTGATAFSKVKADPIRLRVFGY